MRPGFPATIPSTGKKVTFHPFTTVEEKMLLTVKENKGRTKEETLKAVADVVGSCVPGLDVTALKAFDLEFLFIQIRARSVGEVSRVSVKCRDEGCSKPVEERKASEVTVKLLDAKVAQPKKDRTTIAIGTTEDGREIKVELKQPDIGALISGSDDEPAVVKACIKRMYDDEQVYDIESAPVEEFKVWLDGLPTSVKAELFMFFLDAPKLALTVDYKCAECGKDKKLALEGLQSFF